MRGNRIKTKLKAGQIATMIGGHSFSSDTIDFFGPLGFDGFWLEGEHGPISWDRIGDLTRACDLWDMTSVLRVHSCETGHLGRSLDCGANGLVIPHVNSRAAAWHIVQATRFAPQGMRGMYAGRRSFGQQNYWKNANDEIFVMALIEEQEAVDNLDEILAVDHIDAFFVAPNDLAQTMGYVGEPFHPKVQAVVDETLRRIIAAGRSAGALGTDHTLEKYLALGVRLFLTQSDPWLQQGAQAFHERLGQLAQ